MTTGSQINLLFCLISAEAMGGSERLVHSLILHLDRSLFRPSIVCLQGNSVAEEFKQLEIPIHHVPKRSHFDFRAMRSIGQLITKERIDVVHAHHFMPAVYSVYGAKLPNNAGLLYTEHSEWEIGQIPMRWKIAGRYLLGRCDFVVGVSDKVTHKIASVFRTPVDRTATIENGVSLQTFQRNEEDRRRVRCSLRILEDEVVIGIVANLKKIKNHLFLLRSFKSLALSSNRVRLLIVGRDFSGEGDETGEEARHFVESEGLSQHVTFLGERSDVPQLLNGIDIFCLTSEKEGLPISLIEAMAAGLPLVGTDVDGIREVILHGRNGFLVPPGEFQQLSDVLSRLVRDRSMRMSLGAESRRLATSRYSIEHCIRKYTDLYRSAADRSLPL